MVFYFEKHTEHYLVFDARNLEKFPPQQFLSESRNLLILLKNIFSRVKEAGWPSLNAEI
jgi:hypothetical protein